ncbi:MAG TPA: hypothetical protein ENN21_11630 [Spirochaetes bacterium]|nr:hypothetical protein [Spirochaetota bacterium]
MGIYFALQMLVIDLCRKYVKGSMWFWLFSLATFPLWIVLGQVEGWFRWFKVLSVLLPTAIILGTARMAYYKPESKNWFFDFLRKDWVLWFLYGMLALNILVALLKDLQLGNLANAFVGAVLIITMPFPMKYWKFGGKRADILFYSTAGWNFLYTTWNLAFVYAEGVAFFGGTFCILIAAELYPVFKKRPELYIISRVYTLAFHMLMRTMGQSVFTRFMDFTPLYSEAFKNGWGIVNLVIAIPYLFWYLHVLNEGKGEEKFIRTSEDVLASN